MGIIYNILYTILIILYLPFFLARRKFHPDFSMRLGFLPKQITAQPSAGTVWIHAVSVGEAMAVQQLVEELRDVLSGRRLVISTVTETGNRIARQTTGKHASVIYFPLDFTFIVRKVIGLLDPALFIAAETEIWPNLIRCLHKRGVPIAVVNGRISDRSFKGYRLIRFLIRPALRRVSVFCVQTREDARRLTLLGVDEARIRVTGNLKFDRSAVKAAVGDLRVSLLGLRGNERLLVAGSTHPGEEEIVLQAFQALRRQEPALRLLLAPRHPERAGALEQTVKGFGLEPLCISKLRRGIPLDRTDQAVFILDTIGELAGFYAAADIVFVGGSLVKKGGHNILEPALFAKPVIFGPDMSNFRDIAELFLSERACIMVRNGRELQEAILRLLRDAREAQALGERGRSVVAANRGATSRTKECIIDLIKTQVEGKG